MQGKIASLWQHLRQQPLHKQLRLLRWNAPMIVLALAALHQLFVQTVIRPRNSPVGWWLEVLVYAVTGSIVAWWGLTYIARNAAKQSETEQELRKAFAELEDSHKKLLALDRLGQYIASAPNEDEVYKVAVQAPTELVGAKAATLVTFDEDQQTLNLAMAWGLSDDYAQAFRNYLGEGVAAERCRTCSTLHAHVDGDCPLFVGVADAARQDGVQSLMCLPIHTDQERIGILTAYFPSADGPKEEQAHLLNILGGVIAFAVDSLRSRERQMEALHSLDDASRTHKSLSELASQTLQTAIMGWKAQAGAIFLYDEALDQWVCLSQQGLGDFSSARFGFAQQLAQQAFADQSIIIRALPARQSHDLRSAAALPLLSEGEAFGALFLGTKRPQGLNPQHADLLQTFAHQIALALRNAQLSQELQQTAMLRERYRLAREFHDGLAQTLGYLGFQLERVDRLLQKGQYEKVERELPEMRQVVRSAYMDVREAIEGLRLRWDDPTRLAENLENYVEDFAFQTGIDVTFTAHPEELMAPAEVSLQLLRIAQEALTNVRKHARADHVDVQLSLAEGWLELRVSDNGIGFPATSSQTDDRTSGFGLTSMRERAESIGGQLSVMTGPDRGAAIIVTAPVPAEASYELIDVSRETTPNLVEEGR